MNTWISKFSTGSRFKMFVNEMYFKNLDERSNYGEEPQTFKTYVSNNKWFLKKRYKDQNGNN